MKYLLDVLVHNLQQWQSFAQIPVQAKSTFAMPMQKTHSLLSIQLMEFKGYLGSIEYGTT